MTRMSSLAVIAPLAVLAACGGEPKDAGRGEQTEAAEAPASARSAEPLAPASAAASWRLAERAEGTSLVLAGPDEAVKVRAVCLADGGRMLINVPAFRPIGSEDRLSFGSGGAVEAMVADTRGDAKRGGVTATGAVSANLGALIGGPISVSYGAQTSGPHPAPPRQLASAFLAACKVAPPPARPSAGPDAGTPIASVGACRLQDGARLTNRPLRAVGTEPFWGARIEGRCVTYSHPDDQQGTRVWTRFTAQGGGGAGTWRGTLNGQPFVLTARPQPGCSDGMSDRRYPFAVELTVNGAQRRGCAEGG